MSEEEEVLEPLKQQSSRTQAELDELMQQGTEHPSLTFLPVPTTNLAELAPMEWDPAQENQTTSLQKKREKGRQSH